MSRDDRQTKILEQRVKRVKKELRPTQENITVRRRIVDKLGDGKLYYTHEYDRKRNIYIKLDPPIPIQKPNRLSLPH